MLLTEATKEDFRVLDISPDASANEVRQAYHRMKALYSEGSMATYALMEEEERHEMLDRIEKAYLRISIQFEQTHKDELDRAPLLYTAGEVPPFDPKENIGSYLKRRREQLGLPIKNIAVTTCIRSTYLEHIESENYDQLPAPVYLRGFVIEYARSLKLPDPEGLAAIFLDRFRENSEK